MIYFFPILISCLFMGLIGIVVGEHFLLVLDSSIYTNITRANRDFLQVWSDNSYGYSNYIAISMNFFSTIISYFGLRIFSKLKYLELAYYLFILNVIWYSAWYSINKICRTVDFQNTYRASLVAASFYTCNLYMICSWHGGTVESLWVIYALSPLIFSGVMKILGGKYYFIEMAWLGIFCGLAIYSGPYALATFLTLGFVLIIFWRRSYIELFKVALIVSFFGLFSGAPFIFLSIQTFLNGNQNPYVDIYALRTFSQYGLKGLFQFWYEWTMLEFWRGRYFHSYIEYYKNHLIIATALFLWGAFFMMVSTVYRHQRSKMPYVGFLLGTIVIGIFFAKANQAPFGALNLLLYKYWSVMGVFRTPDTKFGLPIITSLSIGLAFYLLSCKGKLIHYATIICVVLQIAIFFTPTPLVEKKADKTFSRIIEIPPGYWKISDSINRAPESGDVLILPSMQQAVFDYKNGFGNAGKDVLGEMINRPIFYVGGFTYGNTYKKYDELLGNAKYANFSDLGFRFIFLRNDLADGISKEYKIYKEDLRLNSTLKLVVSNSLGLLYEVKGEVPPFISAGGDKKVSYTKLSSAIYKLHNEGEFFNSLVMRNSFHPDWSFCNLEEDSWLYMRLLTCSIKKSESYGDLSNSFSGPFHLKHGYIFYPDQIKFYFLLWLSAIGILCVSLFSIINYYAKK